MRPDITHFVWRSAKDLLGTSDENGAQTVSIIAERGGDDERLDAAVEWLTRSIDVCGGCASSKGYRFLKGWMPPYPETSGYIIPTLTALARYRYGSGLDRRALAIGEWLLTVQRADGGFNGRELGVSDKPVVFDTGMILLGLNALIDKTGDKRFAEAGERAAAFLISSTGEDGAFVRNLSNDMLHTYNVRAAWALVAFGRLTDRPDIASHGIANAEWAVRQQQANGFFRNNAFKPGGHANTHGIAYVLRGLLQIHELTQIEALLESTRRAADRLQQLLEANGSIAADLGPDWAYLSRHVCLTGYAQLAIVFLKLKDITGEVSYQRTADRLIDAVAMTQDISPGSAPHRGAIAGSQPIYGRYAPLQYPNWATKFFIDALLARQCAKAGRPVREVLGPYAG